MKKQNNTKIGNPVLFIVSHKDKLLDIEELETAQTVKELEDLINNRTYHNAWGDRLVLEDITIMVVCDNGVHEIYDGDQLFTTQYKYTGL